MNSVRNFLSILSIGLLFAGLWSCQKDETSLSNDALSSSENDLLTTALVDPDAAQGPCYKLVFPIGVKLADGTVVRVGSQEELDKIMRRAATSPRAPRPQILFPYDVILRNGTQVTVENPAALERILKACRTRVNPNPENHLCYTLSYPLTFTLNDGSTITIESKEAHEAFMKRWIEAGNTERPKLSFPYNVTLRNGDILTISNEEDFRKLQELCKNGRKPVDPKPTACYELQFPLNVKLSNGDVVTVNNVEELNKLMHARPTAANRTSIQYPYQVKLISTGDIITLNNDEELKRLLEKCRMR